jgi:hypothetical protein
MVDFWTMEKLHPFANSRGQVMSRAASAGVAAANVDLEAGILRDVVLCQAMQPRGGAGWDWTWVWTPPTDEDEWGSYEDLTLRVVTPQAFIEKLAELGKAFEAAGMQIRFGHPNECNPALGTFAGRARNFRLRDNQVIADITLDDVAEMSPGKPGLKTYILGMASKNPDAMMMSIVFSPGPMYFINAEGQEEDWEGSNKQGLYMLSLPEEERILYERVQAWHFTDFVDQGANTLNMFRDGGSLAQRATDFLDNNPEIMRILVEQPQILENFINRYNGQARSLKSHNFLTMNKSQKKTEDLIDKIKGILGMGKRNAAGEPAATETPRSIENTLPDGTVISIESDSEIPAVGDQVYINGTSDVPPAGTHTLTGDLDGYTITTDDAGLITEVVAPAATTDPAAEPAAASASEDGTETDRQVRALAEAVSRLSEVVGRQAETLRAITEAPLMRNVVVPTGNRVSDGKKGTATNPLEETPWAKRQREINAAKARLA